MSATGFNIDLRDVFFVLFEQLKVQEALADFERYEDFDQDTYQSMIEEATRIAKEVIWPMNRAGDVGCTFHGDGKVTTPPGTKEAWDTLVEAGLIGFNAPFDYGGTNLPEPVAMAVGEALTGAGPAFSTYGGLSRGAANLLAHHGSDFLKETCVEKMNTGEWCGTMCLTEAGAGTSVGDNRCKAVPHPEHEDVYLLEGEKIFITGGDHDLTDNIVHLVLARLPDAPAGTKGLSIFAVPKFGFEGTPFDGERNGAYVVGIEHKMGLNGSATCTLELGGKAPCHGYVIGNLGDGMRIMFGMMNEARIMVGIQGLASASAAYENAKAYAAERVQGTAIKDFGKADAPKVTINQHPDVRRMLMDMRVTVELLRSMLYTTALRLVIAENTENEADAKAKMALVELMTPICKSYATDLGYDVTVTAIQVFGGYGYIKEYPVEQHCRDSKIASIYEGTNGVQAMDLLGRKMRAQNGMVFMNWMGTANKDIAAAKAAGLDEQAAAIQKAVGFLGAAAMHLGKLGMEGDLEGAMLQSMSFLNLFGMVVLGVHALEQATIAQKALDAGASDENFYKGKLLNLDWYIGTRLPHAVALSKSIQAGNTACMDEILFN